MKSRNLTSSKTTGILSETVSVVQYLHVPTCKRVHVMPSAQNPRWAVNWAVNRAFNKAACMERGFYVITVVFLSLSFYEILLIK